MKKINLLFLFILPLIWFGFMYNVSAYNFSSFTQASATDFYAYFSPTDQDVQIIHILCNNQNNCSFLNSDMSYDDADFNSLRVMTRDVLGTNFEVGGTYRISFFFYDKYNTSNGSQVMAHFNNFFTATSVCRSYNNTTSWTASVLDDCTWYRNKVETSTSNGITTDLWRWDFTFKPTTTNIGALSFRINFGDTYQTLLKNRYFDLTMSRYISINATALPDGSVIDYSDNFNDVINNQNQNTQDIIDNNNENTQAIIDSNKSCTSYNKDIISTDGYRLNNDGSPVSSSNYGISDYLSINSNADFYVTTNVSTASNYTRYCFYDLSKTFISCNTLDNVTLNQKLTIPNNASYIRLTINKSENRPIYKICKSGSQAVSDTLTNSDTSEANNDASNFFSGFQTDTYGLSSIITAPLTLIQNLSSASCTDLSIPLPFVNSNLTLPCMTPIYQQHFGSFLTIYQTITFGIVAYWVIVRIFNLIKDFKNPDHDEIEVMDL